MDSSEISGPYLIWNEDTLSTDRSAAGFLLPKAGVLQWIKRGALLTIALLALPPFPYLTGVVWLASLATGYLAAILFALLMVLPLRRVVSGTQKRISVPMHRKLSEWALAATAAHLLLLIVSDTTTIEYLKSTQPVFMIAGNVGLILMAALWATSLEKPRVAIFGSNFSFRPVHIVLSIITVVLVTLHILGSAAFVNGPLKPALFAALSAYAIVLTLRTGLRPERNDPITARSQPETTIGVQS